MATSLASAHDEIAPLPEIPLGRAGMWWFLSSEVMVFGAILGTFCLMRYANGGWHEEMSHVNTRLAALNTFFLLTSSYTVVEAYAATLAKDRKKAQRYLFITVAFGIGFMVNKTLEYRGEFEHGIYPSSGIFWSFYFLATGLHGLHVLGGIIANLMVAIGASRESTWAKIEQRVEYVGLYWHFVDLVWIFLFPLIYLT